jgi:hypothetical protein
LPIMQWERMSDATMSGSSEGGGIGISVKNSGA